MRQHLIMGNWKLNGTKASVEALVEGLKAPVAAAANVEVAVCAPVIFLGQVEQLTAGSALKYGSRAANGVVIITTKQGKAGKPVFKLKSDWGFSNFAMPFRELMKQASQSRRVKAAF
jgi:outer membrane cobalamin receptor